MRNGIGYKRIHDPSSKKPAVHTNSSYFSDKVGYVFTAIRTFIKGIISSVLIRILYPVITSSAWQLLPDGTLLDYVQNMSVLYVFHYQLVH